MGQLLTFLARSPSVSQDQEPESVGAIVALADNTSRSGLAYIHVSGVNPRAKLLSENHPEKTQQSNDGRRGTLHPDETVQSSYTQTNYKGYEQDFHCISPAQDMLDISRNRGESDERKRRIFGSSLEVQRRGADDDLADVHVRWLLDGVSDRASD